MKSYMLDTVIFNKILDNSIDINLFTGKAKLLVTHIQWDQINYTKDYTRRKELSSLFVLLTQEKIPTESFYLGVSKLDDAKLSDNFIPTESAIYDTSKYGLAKYTDGNTCDLIKKELDELNRKKRKGKSNTCDALIAETAIKNNFMLVTEDLELFVVVKKMNGDVMRLDEFLESMRD